MPQRPLSITIIAWFLILSSVWGVYSIWTTQDNPLLQQLAAASPLPPSVQLVLQLINAVTGIIFGAAILKGRDWGRWGFIAWSLVWTVVAFFISPVKAMVLFALLMTAVFAFFLYRKPANAWFAATGA